MKEERRTWKTCDLVTEGGIVIETKRIYNNTIKLFPGCFLLIAMKIDPFLRSELIHINNPFAVAKVGQIQRKSGSILFDSQQQAVSEWSNILGGRNLGIIEHQEFSTDC